MRHTISLFEFMPYGAPELLASARRNLASATLLSSMLVAMVFCSLWVASPWFRHQVRKIAVSMPTVSLAPPPLLSVPMLPTISLPVAPASPSVSAGIPVPVPDVAAPMDKTMATQDELRQQTPGADIGTGARTDAVTIPSIGAPDTLPKLGAYVYTEELPALVTMPKPIYPDIAREAGVSGKVMVRVLVGTNGRVVDADIVPGQSVPMLDQAALEAARRAVFKPGFANNHPVACTVTIPVHFKLH